MPIPIPGSVSREIPESTSATIKPGTSTRADVLLQLADPDVRGKDDRYFLYSSDRSHGGVVLMTLLVYIPVPVATVTGESCAYLAIAFDPNGTVTRVRGFQGKARAQDRTIFEPSNAVVDACASDTELSKAVQEWLNEP